LIVRYAFFQEAGISVDRSIWLAKLFWREKTPILDRLADLTEEQLRAEPFECDDYEIAQV
jgi:hypothetical protein